jgi:hypothetical protein
MSRIRRKFKDYEEVEFSRRSPRLPVDGRYNNDGYLYEEISRNANTLVYERRFSPQSSAHPIVPASGSSRSKQVALPPFKISHPGHLPARQKRLEGAIHQHYYFYDRNAVEILIRECVRKRHLDENVNRLHKRIEHLQGQHTVSASKELRDYISAFENFGLPPYNFPLAFRIQRVAEEMGRIIGGFKAKAMKFVPEPDLHLSYRRLPRVGDPIQGIERDFDVLSRRSAAPPPGSVSEVETGRLPSQRGIPIERGKEIVHPITGVSTTAINADRQGEKVMAIGLMGAVTFKGAATVGVGRPTRVYALLLPKGSIRILGVDMRGKDSPNLVTFKKEVRNRQQWKIFSIRYETSTAEQGQVHLHDDWLLRMADQTYMSQTEYVRSLALAYVEIRETKPEHWTVTRVVDFRQSV